MVDAKSLLLIGLSENEFDKETIRDAYEDKVFELANFFMMRAFVPKLALAKVRRLQALLPIGVALSSNTAGESNMTSTKYQYHSDKSTLKECIKSYHEIESKIKQGLASSTEARETVELYTSWIEVFDAYAKTFVLIYESASYATSSNEAVKLTDQIDITALLAELEDSNGPKPLLNKAYSRLKKMTV